MTNVDKNSIVLKKKSQWWKNVPYFMIIFQLYLMDLMGLYQLALEVALDQLEEDLEVSELAQEEREEVPELLEEVLEQQAWYLELEGLEV